jgi:hypothetical protein
MTSDSTTSEAKILKPMFRVQGAVRVSRPVTTARVQTSNQKGVAKGPQRMEIVGHYSK